VCWPWRAPLGLAVFGDMQLVTGVSARHFDRESDSETVKNELLMFEPNFQKLTLEKTGTYTANPTNCSRAEELLIALISL
jgi:hypothetical protein